jgi:hypothetical protein
MATQSARRSRRRSTALLTATAALLLWTSEVEAAPAIRLSDDNRVPRCVTPERLMAFLAERNTRLDPRFQNIARLYRYYGEGWRVRWDYAFFQMAIETNFLTFRRGDGRRGDVSETQNNFAGIGATGSGVHGERFPDVATGVHAQIQHLVAYSGERLADPIARRTRDKQGDIIETSERLGRPVTFGDLARRWAMDRAYGRSIDYIADLYRARFCTEPPAQAAEDFSVPEPQPARREKRFPFPPPSGLGGPKPDKLAGPETEPEPSSQTSPTDAAAAGEILPWLATPEQKAAAAKPAKPKKSETKRAAKALSKSKTAKVKTIWSRDDAAKPRALSKTAKPAPGTWGSATVVHQDSTQVPTEIPAPAAAPASTAVDDAPSLPTFRITPLSAVTASRLGGPLPQDLGPTSSATAPETAPPTSPQASPQAAAPCHVLSASYGGTKTLLIRSSAGGTTQYTALTVIDGFEKSMFNAYARAEAPGADIVGIYGTRDEALADARVNCPED